jgi:pimeloyl-ACP methyl ester carboxylesterase
MPSSRRTILGSAAITGGLAALGSAGVAGAARGTERAQRRDIVLVHGAWHGGWCWRDVAALLRAEGHRVFAPTLTGLGERAHLRAPVPDLELHIQDVVAHIEAEELENIVLVGHSYGGMVITGVADRLKERIARIVYLDAAVPGDGQSMITQAPGITPEATKATLAALRGLAPDGIWMQPFAPAVLGIPLSNTAATAWVARRLTAHPLPSWTQPIRLARGGSSGIARTYVLCTAPLLQGASFADHAARIRAGEAGPGWSLRELATGHDAMVTDPAGTAAVIQEAAQLA